MDPYYQITFLAKDLKETGQTNATLWALKIEDTLYVRRSKDLILFKCLYFPDLFTKLMQFLSALQQPFLQKDDFLKIDKNKNKFKK